MVDNFARPSIRTWLNVKSAVLRLGVHEKTIMKMGGWKTRSVFDRYNIVDEKDLAEAAELLDAKAQQARVAAQ
jgi:hypothetical protein